MGFIRMNVPMEYPFLPIIKKFNEQELVVNGLEQLHLFFPSEISMDTVLSDNVVGTVDLFSSSNKSGIMAGRFTLSPDPKTNPFLQNLNQRGKTLAASSRLANGGELILLSDSRFLADDAGMSIPENMVFLMNAVDYLAGEKELISLRSREITNRPLDEIEDNTRSRWKWANVLLPSLIIGGLGMYRSRREKDKAELDPKKDIKLEDIINYIKNGVNYFKNKINNPKFFIWSNNFSDLDNIFDRNKFIFVQNNDYINDFYLFGFAKHFIVSPSSFHWWGAWLNQNPNKICVRPSDNLNPSNNKDFWPESWSII